jgi:hypothetical protein
MPKSTITVAGLLTLTTLAALGFGWCVLVTHHSPEFVFAAVMSGGIVPSVVTIRRRRCPTGRKSMIALALVASWFSLAASSALIAEAWKSPTEVHIAGTICFGIIFSPVFIGLPILFIIRQWFWARYDRYEANDEEQT